MLKTLIFTDLDGSLLDRDTFKFDEIKDYLKKLLSKGTDSYTHLTLPTTPYV